MRARLLRPAAWLALVLVVLLPAALSANGVGTIFVLSPGNGTVTIFERVTHSVVATVNVGESPHSVGYSPDTFTAYVVSSGPAHLAVVDRDLYEAVARIPTGGSPLHVAVSPTGQRLYVTDSSQSALLIIDPVGGERAQRPLPSPGHGVAVAPDDRRVYVTQPDSETMTSLDPSTGEVNQVSVGRGASHVAFSPDGGWLYVLRPDTGSLEVVDPRNDRVTASIPTGPGASDLAFTPDARQALVVGAGPEQITVIDAINHRVVARTGLPVAAPATGVALDDAFAYVAVPSANRVWILERTAWRPARELNVDGAVTVSTVPDPFILRIIPRELPHTGSGPGGLWLFPIGTLLVALAVGLVRVRKALRR